MEQPKIELYGERKNARTCAEPVIDIRLAVSGESDLAATKTESTVKLYGNRRA